MVSERPHPFIVISETVAVVLLLSAAISVQPNTRVPRHQLSILGGGTVKFFRLCVQLEPRLPCKEQKSRRRSERTEDVSGTASPS